MNCWSRASQPALNNPILKSAGPVHTLRLGLKREGNEGQLHPQQNVGAGNEERQDDFRIRLLSAGGLARHQQFIARDALNP